MRAVWLREFGGPEVLVAGEAPDPVPGPGQVLVEVAFVNVTFVETQFRASGFGPSAAELPMIPGNGVGGVVAAVGEGVDPSLLGTRVVTGTGGSGASPGVSTPGGPNSRSQTALTTRSAGRSARSRDRS